MPNTFFFAGISPDNAPSGILRIRRAGVGVEVRGYGRNLGVFDHISSRNTGPHGGGYMTFPESHTKAMSLVYVVFWRMRLVFRER